MLRLFDTARAAVMPLETREEGRVSMYVCGPTVYGPPHLGHGRFSLVFDILRRYLLWSDFDVHYVSNITDIDDKIIERVMNEGRDITDITNNCEAVWYSAMDALNVMRPDDDPHATAYVTRMTDLITSMIERGVAYETSDGVYFDPSGVEDYGLLARQDLESLKSGARIEATDEKRSSVDFVLWKKAKPGEPTWDSPWGPGRPGWHTECVVMSLDLLGDGFDIHGGGQDLAFPHHENERAQAIAMGHRFANHWVHNGFVEVGGQKMGKSLGNAMNLMDLIETYDPRAYRLLVLQAHYRSPVEITTETLTRAVSTLDGLDAFARRTVDLGGEPDPALLSDFREAMDNDLNTMRAMDLAFRSVREVHRALDIDDVETAIPLAAAVREILGALGLELVDTEAEGPDDEVKAMMAARDKARNAKDWPEADRLRDAIVASGWLIEDKAGSTAVRRA